MVKLPVLITCERGLGKMRPEVCGRRWAIAHGKVDVGHGSPLGVSVRDSPCRACTFGEARMSQDSLAAVGDDGRKKRGQPAKTHSKTVDVQQLATPAPVPKSKQTTIEIAPTALIHTNPKMTIVISKPDQAQGEPRRCERRGCRGVFPRFKNRRYCPDGCNVDTAKKSRVGAKAKGKLRRKRQSTAIAA